MTKKSEGKAKRLSVKKQAVKTGGGGRRRHISRERVRRRDIDRERSRERLHPKEKENPSTPD